MPALLYWSFHLLGEGVEEAGNDAVDVDVVSGPLHGEDSGQLNDARLGDAVHDLAALGAITKSGGDVDDLAILLTDHVLASGAGTEEGAG